MLPVTRVTRRDRPSGGGRPAERGQILVLAVIALAALLGVSALAVDYGRWLVTKRDFQNQADAAVLAGGWYLEEGTAEEQALARLAAWTSIRHDLGLSLDPSALAAASTGAGAPYEEAGYRIWVASPALDAGADYPGRYSTGRTVFARIERDDRAIMGALLSSQPTTIKAWATAGRNRYRFAIELLCPMGDPRCPGNVRDLKIAGGTHGSIRIVEGDVGSNWGLQVTSASAPGLLVLEGSAYLMEIAPGSDWNPPPWTTGGINRDTAPRTANIYPEPLGGFLDVPDWPLPAGIDRTAGDDCLASDCTPLRADVACGGNGRGASACGTIEGLQSPSVTCSADTPRLAPGTYDRIDIRSGCLILDPTPPGYATCTQNANQAVPQAIGLCRGQTPGVFRVRRSLTIGSGQSSAVLVGDGVTLVLDAGASVSVGNSGALVLGGGHTPGTVLDHAAAAWTSAGAATWPRCDLPGAGATDCVEDAAYVAPPEGELPVAVYVRPPGITSLAAGCGSSIGNLTINGSFGLEFEGAFFAPCTNLALGASPHQGSVGAMIAWSLVYNGQGNLDISAMGPATISPPFLLEPTVGQ